MVLTPANEHHQEPWLVTVDHVSTTLSSVQLLGVDQCEPSNLAKITDFSSLSLTSQSHYHRPDRLWYCMRMYAMRNSIVARYSDTTVLTWKTSLANQDTKSLHVHSFHTRLDKVSCSHPIMLLNNLYPSFICCDQKKLWLCCIKL